MRHVAEYAADIAEIFGSVAYDWLIGLAIVGALAVACCLLPKGLIEWWSNQWERMFGPKDDE